MYISYNNYIKKCDLDPLLVSRRTEVSLTIFIVLIIIIVFIIIHDIAIITYCPYLEVYRIVIV